MEPFPPLRNIDAIPIEYEGQTVICLRDPAGYVEAQLTLSPPAFFVAACLDGRRTLRDVQLAFAQQFEGVLLPADQIQSVVSFLDEQGFLLSERFESIRNVVERKFAETTVRPAYLAGNGYPENKAELGAFIAAMFTQSGGPGPLPENSPANGAPLRCLIAPHIDFQRGALGYAHAYHHLYRHRPPETVIVFGVAHAGAPAPFILTQKDFATPFGTLQNDRAITERLAGVCAWDPYAFEQVHRTEHSIEFQAVMLAYLYGTNVRIVPILCSQFSEEYQADPAALEPVQRFLTECRNIAAASDGNVLVIAGADLAHVGRRFGDEFDITDEIIQDIATQDNDALEHIVTPDAGAFYASVMRDGNARRVCGLGCIYAALKTVEPAAGSGELLHYGHAPDPHGGMVSFAGAKID